MQTVGGGARIQVQVGLTRKPEYLITLLSCLLFCESWPAAKSSPALSFWKQGCHSRVLRGPDKVMQQHSLVQDSVRLVLTVWNCLCPSVPCTGANYLHFVIRFFGFVTPISKTVHSGIDDKTRLLHWRIKLAKWLSVGGRSDNMPRKGSSKSCGSSHVQSHCQKWKASYSNERVDAFGSPASYSSRKTSDKITTPFFPNLCFICEHPPAIILFLMLYSS